ncbi:MAG: ABC transporter ATP-binding protein/permease [Reyranella sp.]|uniref:ABC transporter ATP-binding protein/permease n=1 Tax=Reyranella sp. TaxID=1929291 RepID=UPI001AD408A5|nr:ABC transporter ATP-binding protein/permease [Reyranella sp.]MBN9085363.1 ABC transporter ATP-binding protein/permease [Reyranella sp.]
MNNKVGSFIADWWRLVSPYFKSDDRRWAIPLLVGSIALTFSGVVLDALFNAWNRRFYDALQNKDEATFWREIIFFTFLASIYIAVYIARAIASPYLRLRWRRWLTAHYLSNWLGGQGYYRIELQRSVDNADQRIAEDLRQLGEYSMTLLLGVLSAIGSLVWFTFILWELSGSLPVKMLGTEFNIPGYMAWAALIYALAGSYFANLVGRRLIPLNFMRQRYEANFRFSLVRVRENAEGIALYRGEQREAEALNARFADIFANGWRVLFTQAQLVFYQSGYGQLALIFPFLVTAPRFFAGAITLGIVMQTVSAFGQVQSALSFFIDNYTSLAELRAVMDRLKGLQAATDDRPEKALDIVPEAGAHTVGTEDLTLDLPNGESLLKDARVELPQGKATLISGASGSGKSTLFRALAGIWPFGKGHVHVPAGARVLFLPQKPYIPIGTLRDAVKYPDEHSATTDGEIKAALEAVQLGHLAPRLDEQAHWSNVLSGGEQQRLAAARALVFKPDWLFIDEGTAALDEPMEAIVYKALKTRLPKTTLVSVGHRPSLRQWHDRQIELRRGQGQIGRLVEAAPAA